MRIVILLILIGFTYSSTGQKLGFSAKRKYGLPKQGEVTINGSNEGVVVYIGDSQLAGVNDGTGSGPTPTLGTVKYWSVANQTINDVTTHDIFDSGTLGTPAPQMGIDYYNATGVKLIFCPTANGGSSFYPIIVTGTNNWSDSGIRFNLMVNNVFACLNAAGVDRPLMIKIRLGINDARVSDAGNSNVNVILTEMDNFINKLRALFPTTPIVFDQLGMDSGYNSNGERTKAIRKKIKSFSILYDNVHLTGGLLSFWMAGYYHSDLLHQKQTGHNVTGTMDARWLINSSYSKYARAIIACQFDEPSTNLKDSIAYAIDNNLTEYLGLEYLFYFKTTIRNNCYLDWAMMNIPYDVAAPATFTANVGLDFDGTNDYFRTGYNGSSAFVQTATSSKSAVKIKTNDTAAGTLKYVLKQNNTVNIFQQATSNVVYFANDSGYTLYTTDTKLQPDTEYATGRTGNTKELSKNGTVVHSATITSPALPTTEAYIGSDGTNAFDGILQWGRSGVYSSTSNFYTALQAIADL